MVAQVAERRAETPVHLEAVPPIAFIDSQRFPAFLMPKGPLPLNEEWVASELDTGDFSLKIHEMMGLDNPVPIYTDEEQAALIEIGQLIPDSYDPTVAQANTERRAQIATQADAVAQGEEGFFFYFNPSTSAVWPSDFFPHGTHDSIDDNGMINQTLREGNKTMMYVQRHPKGNLRFTVEDLAFLMTPGYEDGSRLFRAIVIANESGAKIATVTAQTPQALERDDLEKFLQQGREMREQKGDDEVRLETEVRLIYWNEYQQWEERLYEGKRIVHMLDTKRASGMLTPDEERRLLTERARVEALKREGILHLPEVPRYQAAKQRFLDYLIEVDSGTERNLISSLHLAVGESGQDYQYFQFPRKSPVHV